MAERWKMGDTKYMQNSEFANWQNNFNSNEAGAVVLFCKLFKNLDFSFPTLKS